VDSDVIVSGRHWRSAGRRRHHSGRPRSRRDSVARPSNDRLFRWRSDASIVVVVVVVDVSFAGRRRDEFRNPPSTHRAQSLATSADDRGTISGVARRRRGTPEVTWRERCGVTSERWSRRGCVHLEWTLSWTVMLST